MQYSSSADILRLFRQHPIISIDSRKIIPGCLFFGLKGDNFDGNRFAKQALEQEAAYAIIDDPNYYIDGRTILTPNVLSAIQQLAADHRNSLDIPVIGITGTNGKTTTKELIFTALKTKFKTQATSGNLNNHIGVPLTLLSIKPDTEIAIVEMGANHIGEIAELCNMTRPTHGLITNIGKAHLEGFGSFEGVIKAKNELYEFLHNHRGVAFVNADDPLLMDLSKELKQITYGSSENLQISGTICESDSYLHLKLNHPAVHDLQTQLSGNYNFTNVMAALCIANYFGADLTEIKQAIESYHPTMNRSQIVKTAKNTLLLDAYNANPSSMAAALSNFAHNSPQTKVVILGDMFELGAVAAEEHENILKLALSQGFEKVITAGPLFMKAAGQLNYETALPSVDELKQYLKSSPITGRNILIKGSRGMKLETIADEL